MCGLMAAEQFKLGFLVAVSGYLLLDGCVTLSDNGRKMPRADVARAPRAPCMKLVKIADRPDAG